MPPELSSNASFPFIADAYEASLLKAFKKTVEEGRFRVVLVDAPLLKARQLRDYWTAGQAAGYEVYVSRPLETDPEVSTVHDPTSVQIF